MKYAFKRQFGKDNYLMKFLQIVTNVKETLSYLCLNLFADHFYGFLITGWRLKLITNTGFHQVKKAIPDWNSLFDMIKKLVIFSDYLFLFPFVPDLADSKAIPSFWYRLLCSQIYNNP